MLDAMDIMQFKDSVFPSEKLDEIIIDDKKRNQMLANANSRLDYFFQDAVVVNEYASLIDIKLREAIKTLDLQEFREPKGFECKEKSSSGQQYFYKTRNYLEYFLKKDIKHHTDSNAQVNAFRRWVMISEKLLKLHNYDGFFLIFINLQLIAKPYLLNGLPKCTRELYDSLCDLSTPDRNHRNLRQHIESNKSNKDVFPVLLWHHATATLNENIERILCKKEKCLERRAKIKDLIKDPDTSHRKLTQLIRVKKKLDKRLHKLNDLLNDQYEQKEAIISKIAIAQKQNLPQKKCHQQRTYETLIERYENETTEQARRITPPNSPGTTPPNSARRADPPDSNLYSKKLVPSFWARRAKGVDAYWGQVFTSPSIKQ